MGQWPYRTITWHCRKIQENREDTEVMDALYDKDINDLNDLEEMAKDIGIHTDNFAAKIEALEQSDAEEISEIIRSEYRQLYDITKSDGGLPSAGGGCPYEESGMDRACWSCPLSGNVLEELE